MRNRNKTVEVLLYCEPAEETKPELKALDQYADKNGEVELHFVCSVSPYDPGRLSGPPESSYPPEGGEVEDIETTVLGRDGKLVKIDDKWAESLIEHFRDRIDEDAVNLASNDDDGPEYDPDDRDDR